MTAAVAPGVVNVVQAFRPKLLFTSWRFIALRAFIVIKCGSRQKIIESVLQLYRGLMEKMEKLGLWGRREKR